MCGDDVIVVVANVDLPLLLLLLSAVGIVYVVTEDDTAARKQDESHICTQNTSREV